MWYRYVVVFVVIYNLLFSFSSVAMDYIAGLLNDFLSGPSQEKISTDKEILETKAEFEDLQTKTLDENNNTDALANLAKSELDFLTESMVGQFTDGNMKDYEEIFDVYKSDRYNNPLVFHITTKTPLVYWQGLLDLSVRKKLITSKDILWIIEEYVTPYRLKKTDSQLLFDMIFSMFSEKKYPEIKLLLTNILFSYPGGFFYGQYRKNEKFNLLIIVLEKGYSNPVYTEIFKKMIDVLPSEGIDSIDSAQLIENNVTVTCSLVKWIIKNSCYLDKNYKNPYLISGAKYLFAHRLKTGLVYDKHLLADFKTLAGWLFYGKHISNDEYARTCMRFEEVN